MRMKRAYGVLAVVTLALLFGERVEAQLAKQGTYTGLYGWSLSSTASAVQVTLPSLKCYNFK